MPMGTSVPRDGDVVLIVDDVPENLAVLCDLLDEAGYTVLVATDGERAIETARHVAPDVILLDAVMPGLDGFETCRRLKAEEATRDIPVVFMTGLTETEHVLAGFAAGGTDYVTKPIQPVEVLARIAAHVQSARRATRARDAIDAAGGGLVVMDAEGTPILRTRQAVRWLAEFFDLSESAPGLPSAVRNWALERVAARSGSSSEDANVLIEARAERQLALTYAGAVTGGFLFKLEVARLEPEAVPLAETFNLTPRELEVLLWVSRGKTNRDIGDILGLSPRTVNKHLEHIYEKLGVETRTAAAALAMRGGFSPSVEIATESSGPTPR
jgi:DNA-binding NarL/FixJ family response regulator